ncbi:MAG: M23 family metallopeptidase [Rhizobiaceae bacterium]|nr:M23 family metallopeptidase [Rhizobiaceae bacterium]
MPLRFSLVLGGVTLQQKSHSAVFGRRTEPHTVIIARGDEIRHFTIRPWLAAVVGSVLAAVAIGYLLATSYLVLRDDLIGASVARQARLQQAYEDRISALRAQVDRITSRQLLDQRLMETKVSELLQRQSQLYSRHGRLRPILDRAEGGGLLPNEIPVPDPRPEDRAGVDAETPIRAASEALESAGDGAPDEFALWNTRHGFAPSASAADRADILFAAINKSLRRIEDEQMVRLTTLAQDADRTADAITEALAAVGLDAGDEADETSGIGGPLLAIDDRHVFEARVNELDEALTRLEEVKQRATLLPIHSPAPGYAISSTFGIRRDPILKTPAMHAGLDFRVPSGRLVKATGQGRVVAAGWNGGYGRMVEVDHGDGLTTRYAHLSKISVSEGDIVERGTTLGKVGSSGRSTGAHLHYEIRRNGTAIDPLRFIKAGRRVSQLL